MAYQRLPNNTIVVNREPNSPTFQGSRPNHGTNHDRFSDFLDELSNVENLDSDVGLTNTILNSTIYQQAYEILSQADNPMWLSRLQQIPFSVVSYQSTWLDDLGLTNATKDKNSAVLAEAYKQIQDLLQQYHLYVQTLPVTQVNQADAAGFNMAVTGEGLDSATIEGTSRDLSAHSIQRPQPIDTLSSIISDAINIVGSVTNGATTFVNAFSALRGVKNSTNLTNAQIDDIFFKQDLSDKQLNLELQKFGISRQQYDDSVSLALNNVRESLISQGYDAPRAFTSWNDFESWWNQFGMDESLKLYKGRNSQSRLFSSLREDYINSLSGNLYSWNSDGSSQILNDDASALMDSIVDSQIELYRLRQSYEKAKLNFERTYQMSLDPQRLATIYMDKSEYEKDLAKYEKEMRFWSAKISEYNDTIINDWIGTAQTPKEKAILARILHGISSSEMSQISHQGLNNVTSGVSAVGDAASSVTNVIPGL